MLRWLGDKHGDAALTESAQRIELAVEHVLAKGDHVPRDLGGTASCTDMTQAVCRALSR
jgi:3-isopropylmalate dehydrogenase